MSAVAAMVGRNLRLFFRDRMNVFFSLLGPLILFGLYTLFLARLQSQGLEEQFPAASAQQVQAFVSSWMFSGVVLLTTITTGLGALSALVDDGSSGRFRDFLVSPVRRGQLVLGYLIAATIVAIVMSLFILAVSVVYLGLVESAWLAPVDILTIAAVVLLCCAGFTALSALAVSFVRTSAAFSGFATVVGTVIGFIAGAYIPVGSLPDGVASGVNALPFAQGAMLLRRGFTDETLPAMVGDGAGAAGAADALRDFYGIDAYVGDAIVPAGVAVAALAGVAVVFTVLSALRIRSRIR